MVKHNEAVNLLEEYQESQTDMRCLVRDAFDFVYNPNGQWEEKVRTRFSGKPMYTFNKVKALVKAQAGAIATADFDIRVAPMGGSATRELAQTYNGLLRNIQNISKARHVFANAARNAIAGGLGGWEVVTDWVGESFEQDFIIRWLPNFEDRVFFDDNSVEQDAGDAMNVFVLDTITQREFKKKFKRMGKSLCEDRDYERFYYKPENVTVGRFIYKKPIKSRMIMLSDGSTYEVTPDLQYVIDEKREQGLEVIREREYEKFVICSKMLDADDWLTDEEETVFKNRLPVFPVYSNFDIREGKVTYFSDVADLFDAQRVYNYARSREVEDVALSPPDMIMATRTHVEEQSDRSALENASVSGQRVFTYTPDPLQPGGPTRLPGPSISPGIQQVVANSTMDMQEIYGSAPLQRGDPGRELSGTAIGQLNARADTSSMHNYLALEVAICATGRLLVDSIPYLYDTTMQKRILNEDGTAGMVTINEEIIDRETMQSYVINDLSQGKYDVTCTIKKSYADRREQAVAVFTELAQYLPALGEMTADLVVRNVDAPGAELAADRLRKQLFEAGIIPESQMTNDEKQIMQQMAAQPKEPSPEEKIAEAELQRVQAETQDVIQRAQLKLEELRIREQQSLMKSSNDIEKVQIKELELALKKQKADIDIQKDLIDAQQKGQAQILENLKLQAETLSLIKTAMGADAIIDRNAAQAYEKQAQKLAEEL